jgi:CMP-N,N'-diacetyllegionaminic acid synthase
MKILGFIPARGGSKGVLGKNKKLLGGVPLIEYSIQAAKQSRLISEVFISTDDPEIALIAEKCGIDVPELRPSHLALDTTPTLPVITYTLEYLRNRGTHFDAVCILQPTSPFRAEGLVDDCIVDWLQSDVDTLFTIVSVPHEFNPHWVFEKAPDGNLFVSTGDEHIIPRRQLLPPAYIRDGSLYIIKTSVIESGTLYGNVMRGFDNSKSVAINIDTKDDWLKAELYLQSLSSK